MIVNHADLPTALRAGQVPHSTWRCLARRGMLHSETEAVDHLRAAPRRQVVHHADDVVEEALYVVSGSAELSEGAATEQLRPGHVVLLGPDTTAQITAGPSGVELVSVRTMPARVSALLPPRVPELLDHPTGPQGRSGT
ncbi:MULTISPECIES: hypothetical protein [Actinosynnema]|uniref:hypothetical protein n=1 Tax=Actinosynnema TaxID=40566 RepID=UPI0020A54C34|nr:hypothetical protein [Actinosynnema pretiosum]MCP2094791.1 hypothetical protein [Actinosynnema pretiosum]